MKNLKYTIVIWFVFIAFSRLNAQTVYITDSGKKYHAKNCSLVKTGKKGIALKDAVKEGYTPCKMCKADDIKAIEEKPSGIKEKEKKQKLISDS